MQQPSLSQIVAILVVLALVLIGATIEGKIRKLRASARGRAAVKRGLLAEREAEEFLKAQGFKLVERHTPGSYAMIVDGEPQVVHVKADYLLEKGGKTVVAEVKTGKAVKIEQPDTRRQVLEYQLAFGVESMLLVDMESRTMRTVRFPLPAKKAGAAAASAPAQAKRASRRWAAIAVVGVVLAWWLGRAPDAKHALDPKPLGAKAPDATPTPTREAKPARGRDVRPATEPKPVRAPAAKH